MSDGGGESDTGSPQSTSSVRRERGDRATQPRAGGGLSEESAERHATKKTERDLWAEQQAAHGAEGRSYGEHTEIVEPAVSREDENESGGDRYARDGAGQGARSRHAKHHARDAEQLRHAHCRRVAIQRRQTGSVRRCRLMGIGSEVPVTTCGRSRTLVNASRSSPTNTITKMKKGWRPIGGEPGSGLESYWSR